ncbi:hypothetical protein [Proteus sp. PR00208]|uniref:hypothetical protein n=1 Tax=Proteus sp. PR00208 TaxID=2794025 RepID=UPI001E565A93|nr:hypothetical protein [Proteus sp. PR00208]
MSDMWGNDLDKKIKTVSYIVCELFLIRQVAMHCRPIFRTSLGDIRFGVESLQSFLLSYYSAGMLSDFDIAMHFMSMLKNNTEAEPSVIISLFPNHNLTDEAIEEISGLLEDLAQMETDTKKGRLKAFSLQGCMH